jgi:hypothetical protein
MKKMRYSHGSPLSWLALGVSVLTILTPATSRAYVLETPTEFVADGDYDGDGKLDVVVIDRQTGAARVAFRDGVDALVWEAPFASGIAKVSSVSVGRVASTTWDSIVVTGPDANRIHRLDPRDALLSTGVVPVPIYPPGIGPNLVAALDSGGAGNTAHDDYYVSTQENPGARATLLRNKGTTPTVLIDEALPQPITSANTFEIKSAQGKRLGVMSRLRGTGLDSFQLLDFSAGTVVTRLSFPVPLPNAPNRPGFVAHRFDPRNVLGQVLFYRPGDPGFLRYQVREAGADFQLGGSNQFLLSGPLQLLHPLPLATGGRLLAFFGSTTTNLTNATIYEFNGVTAPSAVSSFSGRFSGAVMLSDGDLALLSADAAGRSDSVQILLANGAGYVLGASGRLPRITRFSGAANALLFDAEPFVNASARPQQLQQHPEWSTGLRVSPTVRVTSQQFLNESNGLVGFTTRDFGPALSGVTTGLVNQYTPFISVFSGRPAMGRVDGEVGISPSGGRYGEAQRLSFTTNGTGTWEIRYRTLPDQDWSVYIRPFLLFRNSTVEFYGRRGSDGALTLMGRADYTFNKTASEIDSDNDGVPDFVEQARGLDPLGGADSDGDGFSDLEELARGTNPRFAPSKPANSEGLRSAFHLLTSPRSPHPNTGADTRSRTGVAVRAFALGGAFLGESVTSPAHGIGLNNPAALLTDLIPDTGARLLVQTTSDHFDIVAVPDSRTGRELIGLVPVPPTNGLSIAYVSGNGSQAAEATSWIAAASNAVATAENPTVSSQLTSDSALVAALFERHVARALAARGRIGAINATLFGFRAGDAGRLKITLEDLIQLEQYGGTGLPGYSQQAVFEFLDTQTLKGPSAAELLSFTRELWRVSAAQHNTNEGLFSLPFDQLRRILAGQSLTGAYARFPSLSTLVPVAQSQASTLLSSVPSRPRTNLTVIVTSVGVGVPIELRHSTGRTPVTLWRYGGIPCAFPPNLQLLPGTRLTVLGHTDLPTDSGTLAVEVITLGLSGVPMPSPEDQDGNLLVDAWEALFLGGTGSDPFADHDGDGYSSLQEMLEGTAPDDRLRTPGGGAFSLTPPVIELVPNAGSEPWSFVFSWPAVLMSRFQFGLVESEDVSGSFVQTTSPLTLSSEGDRHEVRLPPSASPRTFYRLTVRLSK